MNTELLKEPEGVVADFHVKLQSDTEPQPGDPGKSLVAEVAALRTNVQQLCQAVRGLVQLQSVLNTAVLHLVKNSSVGPDCGVI